MSVALLSDDKIVVSGLSHGTFGLWEMAIGGALQTYNSYSDTVESVVHCRLAKTLRMSNYWVLEGQEEILWLPPDYQSLCNNFGTGLLY
jgi:hypothetical protein